jgi:hypothetical protein
VPQVASDAKTYAVNHQQARSARSPQASDQAPATPFASLLDDSAQSAPDLPSQPASTDGPSCADRPVRTSQAASSNGNTKSSVVKFAAVISSDAISTDLLSTEPISSDAVSSDLALTDPKSSDAISSDPKTADAKFPKGKFSAAKFGQAKSSDIKFSDVNSANTNLATANSADATSTNIISADDTSTDTDNGGKTGKAAKKASNFKPISDATMAAGVKPANANSADATSAADAISADATSAAADNGGKTSRTSKKINNFNLIGGATMASGAKTAARTARGGDSQPVSDGEPADAQISAVITAAPASTPIPAIAPADAGATVLAPEPDAVSQTSSPTPTLGATSSTIVAAPKAKSGERAYLQANSGKPADTTKLSAKAASQPQTDGKPQTTDKPQATSGDADKDAVAQARGDTAGKGHRAADIEAPVTLAPDTNTAAPKTVADAMQPAALTAPTQNMPALAATNAAPNPAALHAALVPLSSVAIEITNQALAGKNHFEIRLDPPELGRIEVRLDVDRDGNVTSRMIADRADTLDLLRRDASGLERALQDAGLKTADNSLQFSLRDHSSQQQQDNSGANTARLVVEDNTLSPIDAAQRGYSRLAGQGSGIDIHV